MNIRSLGQDPARAIVIGMDSINGLQSARILKKRGVPVIGVTRNLDGPCAQTRVCEEMILSDRREVELIEALKELGPRLAHKAVLFPCNDPEVWLISQHRNELAPWYHIALPPKKTVDILLDKDSFYEYAQQNNFPISRTFTSACEKDLVQATSLTFPCIVKPPARTIDWDRHVAKKGIIVADMEELERCCARVRPWSSKLVVQEWVAGGPTDLYACNCYFDRNSRPLVSFVSRKIRQWPHDTGIGSAGEECRNDEVRDRTIALFTEMKFVGLAYLEMKRDTRTGRHVIIEPNIGRPTGRSALAEAGGVELLLTMYCDLLGLPLPSQRTQTFQGVKWIDLRHDCQSALLHWRRGELTFLGWLRSIRGKRIHTLFSWRDPAPFIADVWYIIKKGARRLVMRRKSK